MENRCSAEFGVFIISHQKGKLILFKSCTPLSTWDCVWNTEDTQRVELNDKWP